MIIEKIEKKDNANYRDNQGKKTDTSLSRIAFVALIIAVIIAFGSSFLEGGNINIGGGSSKKAVAAVFSKSAYPPGLEQAVEIGLYDNLTLGDVFSYMFKNPKTETHKEGNYYLVTISGNYRYKVGGDYVYSGSVTYRVSESGSVFFEKGDYGIGSIIEGIAMERGKN